MKLIPFFLVVAAIFGCLMIAGYAPAAAIGRFVSPPMGWGTLVISILAPLLFTENDGWWLLAYPYWVGCLLAATYLMMRASNRQIPDSKEHV